MSEGCPHPDRPRHALGLCFACYHVDYRRRRKAYGNPHRSSLSKRQRRSRDEAA